MKISERLKSISEYVPPSSNVADIGTDHGYLLKYLLDKGQILIGFACDLNKKPLTYAKNNLKEYIKADKAQLRLGNGLEALNEDDKVDCIVIAGMGGRTMVDILEGGQNILENVKRVILAPNASWDFLREYVTKKDFKIVDEDLVLEDGRFYPIIIIEKSKGPKLTPTELFLGPKLIEKKHMLLKEFFEYEKQRADKNILKMHKSENPEIKRKIIRIQRKWMEMSRCFDEL